MSVQRQLKVVVRQERPLTPRVGERKRVKGIEFNQLFIRIVYCRFVVAVRIQQAYKSPTPAKGIIAARDHSISNTIFGWDQFVTKASIL